MNAAYPARCTVCRVLCPSDEALETHLAEAKHWEEPGYALLMAKRRVTKHQNAIELHTLALVEAEAEVARIEAKRLTGDALDAAVKSLHSVGGLYELVAQCVEHDNRPHCIGGES